MRTSKAGPFVPRGKEFQAAVERWKSLASDPGAQFDTTIELDAAQIAPQVTWGTNPGMVTSVTGRVPDPASFADPDAQKAAAERARNTWPCAPARPWWIFPSIASSSAPAPMRASRICAPPPASCAASTSRASLKAALVVPGSRVVKAKAEQEGLDRVFRDAGFEWRDAGCSMCIAMNDDVLPAGERSASTSNRNFEGRQGKGSRTHLVSPIMAAAAAIAGHFVDVRDLGVDVTE